MCAVEFAAALRRDEIRWKLWCGDGVRPDVGEGNVAYVRGSSRQMQVSLVPDS